MTHYSTLIQRCRATNSLLADELSDEFHRLELENVRLREWKSQVTETWMSRAARLSGVVLRLEDRSAGLTIEADILRAIADSSRAEAKECETVPVQQSGQATAEHGGGGADPILREAVTPTPSTSTPL